MRFFCSFEIAADFFEGVGVAAVVSWLFGFLQVDGLLSHHHCSCDVDTVSVATREGRAGGRCGVVVADDDADTDENLTAFW